MLLKDCILPFNPQLYTWLHCGKVTRQRILVNQLWREGLCDRSQPCSCRLVYLNSTNISSTQGGTRPVFAQPDKNFGGIGGNTEKLAQKKTQLLSGQAELTFHLLKWRGGCGEGSGDSLTAVPIGSWGSLRWSPRAGTRSGGGPVSGSRLRRSGSALREPGAGTPRGAGGGPVPALTWPSGAPTPAASFLPALRAAPAPPRCEREPRGDGGGGWRGRCCCCRCCWRPGSRRRGERGPRARPRTQVGAGSWALSGCPSGALPPVRACSHRGDSSVSPEAALEPTRQINPFWEKEPHRRQPACGAHAALLPESYAAWGCVTPLYSLFRKQDELCPLLFIGVSWGIFYITGEKGWRNRYLFHNYTLHVLGRVHCVRWLLPAFPRDH